MAAAESLGLPAVRAVLAASEAGLPIPVPSDLLLLVLGERAGAGSVSVWLAVAVLEAVVIIGVTALFLGARGPARGLVNRFGPKVGLPPARGERAAQSVERPGPR